MQVSEGLIRHELHQTDIFFVDVLQEQRNRLLTNKSESIAARENSDVDIRPHHLSPNQIRIDGDPEQPYQ